MKISPPTSSLQPKSSIGKELVRLGSEGPAPAYAAALKSTGVDILNRAVEVFCDSGRTLDEAMQALGGLKDLKNSMIGHMKAVIKSRETSSKAASELEQNLNSGHIPGLVKAETKVEKDAQLILSADTKRYPFVRRVWEAERAILSSPEFIDKQEGLRDFLTALTGVQAAYAAAVAVPGPVSASVNSVAKEVFHSGAISQGSASSSSSGSGAALGLLGVAGRDSRSESSSGVDTRASAHYEKSKVDERVVSVLLELEERLEQVSVDQPTVLEVSGQSVLEEVAARRKNLFGKPRYQWGRRDTHFREIKTFVYEPERVRLPHTSISDVVSIPLGTEGQS